MTARKPTFFEVPAALQARPCTSCGQLIYLVRMASGSFMPVTCKPAGCTAPAGGQAGRGMSHFIDCPKADRHRRRG